MLNVQVLDRHDDNVDGWRCEPGEELSSIAYWLFNGNFHNAYGLDLEQPEYILVEKDYEDVYTVSWGNTIIYGIYFDQK